MSFSFNPSFHFLCGSCKETFPSADQLKIHKIENHLGDCIGIKCIVFEERLLDHEFDPAELSSSDNRDLKPLPKPGSSKRKFRKTNFQNQDSPSSAETRKKFTNPFVSLKPLTTEEINPHQNTTLRKDEKADSVKIDLVETPRRYGTRKRQTVQSSNSDIYVYESKQTKRQKFVQDTKPLILNPPPILKQEPDVEEDTEIGSNETEAPLLKEPSPAPTVALDAQEDNTEETVPEVSISPHESSPKSSTAPSETTASAPNDPDPDQNDDQVKDKEQDPDWNPDADSGSDADSNGDEAADDAADDAVDDSESQSKPESTTNKSPSKPLPELISLKSSEQTPQNSTTPNTPRQVSTRFKTKLIPTSETKNLLNLDIPLAQWIKEKRDKNPTHIILVEPDITLNTDDNPAKISAENPIMCKLCRIPFTTEVSIRSHINKCFLFCRRKHRYCHLCDKVFARATNLKIHALTMHAERPRPAPTEEEKQFKCPNTATGCVAAFKRPQDLKRHLIIHGRETPFKCSTCGKCCSSADTLADHERTHSGDRPFKCQFENCSWSAKTKQSLVVHNRIRHGEQLGLPSFPCPAEGCDRTFGLNAHLKYHLERQHHPDKETTGEVPKPFKCEICGACFLLKYYLTGHMKSHSNHRPHKCPEPDCPATFKRNQELRRHLIIHGKVETPFNCSFCGKYCQSSECLANHERTHTGDRPFACTVSGCDCSFTSKNALWSHTRTRHSEELGLKQYLCSTCGKVFGTQSLLTRHIKVNHMDERPFKCNYVEGCEETFKCKISLVEHIRVVHTGDTPYQCDKCGRAFARRKAYVDHEKLHEGTFLKAQCHLCPRKFVGSWGLKKHLKAHEEGTAFICRFCGLHCTSKSYLKKHERSHIDGDDSSQGEIEVLGEIEGEIQPGMQLEVAELIVIQEGDVEVLEVHEEEEEDEGEEHDDDDDDDDNDNDNGNDQGHHINEDEVTEVIHITQSEENEAERQVEEATVEVTELELIPINDSDIIFMDSVD